MRRRAEVHKHAVTERISTVRRDEAKLIKMREKKNRLGKTVDPNSQGVWLR